MKKILVTFYFLFLALVTCNCQTLNSTSESIDASMESDLNSCPISLKTTKIIYHEHTNSGVAIYTTITIFEDHLVYERNYARKNHISKYSCEYSKDEFNELIMRLSKVQFSATYVRNHKLGGPGFEYSFESDSGQYLQYNNVSKLSGNYEQVSSLIQKFIEEHKNGRLILK
jgi:hypothetical protein